ncbi:sigma factor [Erythrobacter rubeus]|uniref:RNA polymerase sigma-70 region 2 domain-containing protein n=1 Tax=Erythrobacter rubeus TaxID=2760803 RepID=A0ABR8KW20_9SPHN|nr:sigma factor [Erythrobacter rubeus]MBD2843273.1 hypothetical protein [Erythrobacter rubeus]
MGRPDQSAGKSSRSIERIARELTAEHSATRRAKAPDHQFAELLTLLGPRIARMVRRYGLCDMRDDAEQVAAIGVHRALVSFDPERASFSTHVTWQIRGELQGLRHRMRLDQRRSARIAGIKTVAIEGLRMPDAACAPAGDFEVVDDSAQARSERAASDSLVRAFMHGLFERLSAPEHERVIVIDYLFERETRSREALSRTPEQRRQIVRRTFRNCARIAKV